MNEKKNAVPMGTATVEKGGQEGVANWLKFLKEKLDHVSKMSAGEKRAVRRTVKKLYQNGKISRAEYDDAMLRLK